jgi:hypothetical protein
MVKAGCTFYGVTQFVDNLGNKTLFTLDNLGRIDRQTAGTDPNNGVNVLVDKSVFNPKSFLCAKPAFGRLFMAGYGDTANGNNTTKCTPQGPVHYTDGLFDPVAASFIPAPLAPTATDNAYLLSSASNAVAGNTTYTAATAFTIPFLPGTFVTFTVFANPANLGTYTVVSCNATTLVVNNAAGVAEVHLGAAVSVPLAGFALSAAANASGGNTSYTGLFTAQAVGTPMLINGFANAANNGSFTVVTCTSTTLIVNNAAGVAETHAALATVMPSMTAGAHQVRIVYETQQGALSIAGPAATLISTSGQGVITNISTGPSYVVARHVIITLVGGTGYYMPQAWRINDNISTSFIIDLADATIQRSYVANPLLSGAWSGPPLSHLTPDGPGVSPTPVDSVNAGSITAGIHKVQVVFETYKGYLTQPSAPISWNAAGNFKVVLTNITTGPWYVAARRLLFTVSAGADFYYISSTMRIADNTTTTLEVDFSDISLLQGTNYNRLTRNYAVPDMAGVGAYNAYLTAWGGLNTIKGANLGFDGGFGPNGIPNGWAQGANVTYGVPERLNTYDGEAWTIYGTGAATSSFGQILSPAIAPLLQPNTPYTISFWATMSAGFNSSLVVAFYSGSTGVIGGGTILRANFPGGVGTTFTQFTVGAAAFGTIPSDLVVIVFASGNAGVSVGSESVTIDHIQIWPTNQQFEASVLRVSNPFDPETFDGLNGLVQISKDDGQRITAAVQLRSFYYVFKERSMHVTIDDGINPPALWLTRQIDSTVGVPSPNAVVSTESMVAIASRNGAYIFMGGRPIKVSQEIQTTWETIDWSRSTSIHVMIDPQKKRVFFYVPITGANPTFNLSAAAGAVSGNTTYTGVFPTGIYPGAAVTIAGFSNAANNGTFTCAGCTSSALIVNNSAGVPETLAATAMEVAPHNCLILDYSEGMGDEDNPAGRKWALDLFPLGMNASLRYETTNNTQALFLAGPKIFEHAGTDDDTIAIPFFYYTAYYKAGDRGQDLFGGCAVSAEGAGNLQVQLLSTDDSQAQILGPAAYIGPPQYSIPLVLVPGKQYELYGNLETERAQLAFFGNAIGCYFTLKAVTIYAQPWSEARAL